MMMVPIQLLPAYCVKEKGFNKYADVMMMAIWLVLFINARYTTKVFCGEKYTPRVRGRIGAFIKLKLAPYAFHKIQLEG